MSYPFLTIEPIALYQTVLDDGSDKFVVRLQQSVDFWLLKANNLKSRPEISLEPTFESDEVKSLFSSAFLDWDSLILVIGGSEAPRAFKKALRALYEKSEATMLTYLLLLCSFLEKGRTFTILDIVKEEGLNVFEKSAFHRFEKIATLIGSEVGAYFNKDDYMLLHAQPYTSLHRDSVVMEVQDIIERSDNIYYRIEIFGNNHYAIYHPYLKKIEELTGISLVPIMNHREYQSNMSMLRTL